MTEQSFWQILDMLNWENQGDDDAVLEPALKYLSELSDEEIFSFEDIMSKLLYNIDSKKLAQAMYKNSDYFSDDFFLYNRCVALVNGKNYYYSVLNGRKILDPDLEFESLLYLPVNAWAKKHSLDTNEYPHLATPCYETGSNKVLWE